MPLLCVPTGEQTGLWWSPTCLLVCCHPRLEQQECLNRLCNLERHSDCYLYAWQPCTPRCLVAMPTTTAATTFFSTHAFCVYTCHLPTFPPPPCCLLFPGSNGYRITFVGERHCVFVTLRGDGWMTRGRLWFRA
jgi:hypothetical protein